MAPPDGSPQSPNNALVVGGARARRRVPRIPGIDRAAFALAVGLAAFLTMAAIVGTSGFEIVGLGHLPLSGDSTDHRDDSEHAAVALRPAGDHADPSEAAPADSWSSVAAGGRVRYQSDRTMIVGTAAIALLDYDWEERLPNWSIDFIEGNDQIAGLTWSREQRIEVFVRATASEADVARILAHELGHAVDVTHLSPEQRTTWLEQRNAAEDTPWWPSSSAADFETGAGDFAESFAVWLVGPGDYRSELAPAPTADDLELIAHFAR